MGRTEFNTKMTRILNNQIDEVDLARIHSIIGTKKFEYVYIDEEWMNDQYVGDGQEYKHPKFGTVTIKVEVSILDIIGDNVLLENKRIYTGKYSEEVHEIILYFFGPIEKELLEEMIKNN